MASKLFCSKSNSSVTVSSILTNLTLYRVNCTQSQNCTQPTGRTDLKSKKQEKPKGGPYWVRRGLQGGRLESRQTHLRNSYQPLSSTSNLIVFLYYHASRPSLLLLRLTQINSEDQPELLAQIKRGFKVFWLLFIFQKTS